MLSVASTRVTPDTTAAVAESLVGRCIDERYQLEAEIGVGGLGSVYRALHTKLQRPVAVKLLHENYGSDLLQRRRFEREAKALAALGHPHIVAILDYGVSENRPYLVMELLEGETLAQRLKRGQIALKPALSIAQQLLEALAFMHNAGLVHRDVKPSNVFLQRMPNGRERVKVLDFGLAKFTAPTVAGSDPTLTRDGTIVGTPAYMSPEQATGDMVDARGDVYAVGVILFQMLAGKLPFEGDAIQLIRSHLVATVPTLEQIRPEGPASSAIDTLIQRAMAKQREERFADAGEMLRALLMQAPSNADLTTPKVQEPSGSTLADIDPLTGELMIALDDSNDAPTAVRSSLPAPTVPARAFRWLRKLVRRALLTGVRVVAAVSVVLVALAIAIVTLLFREPADRADLVKLQQRVSDRLVERSFRGQTSQPTAHKAAASVPPTPIAPAKDGKTPAVSTAAGTASPAGSEALIATTDTTQLTAMPPTAAPSVVEPSPPAAAPDPAPPSAEAVPPAANELRPPDVPGPPPARNPWNAGTPKELRALRKLVGAGGRAGERAALALRAYNQEHVEDARGHLLLGQLYYNRLWRSDALAQFATALQLDLSARGAPEVLPTLIDLVLQSKVSNQAERLIVKSYGSEALTAVDEAIAKEKDPTAVARLRLLRSRLGS